MIPKIIHCCWLSGSAKNSLARKCRKSWEQLAPGFEIREWDRNKLSEEVEAVGGLSIPSFVMKALSRRKWSFAADWVRFAALYLNGGVYFDFDFELMRPIDDLISEGEFVAGQWLPDGTVAMEPAIIALEKGSPIAKAMLDYYSSAEFDGRTTVGAILSDMVKMKGGGELWKMRVLPPEVFSPIDVNGVCHRTVETRGIHHYAMSWVSPLRRLLRLISWHGGRGLVDAAVRIKRMLRAPCPKSTCLV